MSHVPRLFSRHTILVPAPDLVYDFGTSSTKHVDSMNISFTDPPKEFLVSGSTDHGHSWRQVFGTDLNTSSVLKIPVHGDYTHLKLTFLQPQAGSDVFGVRHVEL